MSDEEIRTKALEMVVNLARHSRISWQDISSEDNEEYAKRIIGISRLFEAYIQGKPAGE